MNLDAEPAAPLAPTPLERALGAALFALGAALVVFTHDDYGITWDDEVQVRYGRDVAQYFATLGRDQGALSHYTRFYGPLFELAALGLTRLLQLDVYRGRHLATALAGLCAFYGVYRIGRSLGGPRTGLLAALALALMPRFYGQCFVNGKDAPFAAAVTLAMWAALGHIAARASMRSALVLGVALGGALAVRPGGLPVLAMLLGLPHAIALARGAVDRSALLRSLLVVTVVAWLLMVSAWPFAWQDPLQHPPLAILSALSFPVGYPVLFEGTVVQSDALPGHYLLEYLAITLPLPLLALGAFGLWVALAGARRGDAARASALYGVVAWFALPFATALVLRPHVYDGMRHVLFTLPAFAIACALGAERCIVVVQGGATPWFTRGATRRGSPRSRLASVAARGAPHTRRIVLALGALLCAAPALSIARLHPYETTYFNALVGGVGGAYRRYETDYFLLAYREAAAWIDAQPRPHPGPTRVLVAADDHGFASARHFLDPSIEARTLFRRVDGALPERYDYYLGTSRYDLHESYPDSPIVHSVGRDGAVFAVVRARR